MTEKGVKRERVASPNVNETDEEKDAPHANVAQDKNEKD